MMNTLPDSNATGSSDLSKLIKKEVDPRMHSAEHILTGALMRMFGCARPFTTFESGALRIRFRLD